MSLVGMFKIWTQLGNVGHAYNAYNPPIRWMLSFMGQGQLGKSGKLATFACWKRILENPN